MLSDNNTNISIYFDVKLKQGWYKEKDQTYKYADGW